MELRETGNEYTIVMGREEANDVYIYTRMEWVRSDPEFLRDAFWYGREGLKDLCNDELASDIAENWGDLMDYISSHKSAIDPDAANTLDHIFKASGWEPENLSVQIKGA